MISQLFRWILSNLIRVRVHSSHPHPRTARIPPWISHVASIACLMLTCDYFTVALFQSHLAFDCTPRIRNYGPNRQSVTNGTNSNHRDCCNLEFRNQGSRALPSRRIEAEGVVLSLVGSKYVRDPRSHLPNHSGKNRVEHSKESRKLIYL